MAVKKTIFHQIISCKNTLQGVSQEAKRRRKIRTLDYIKAHQMAQKILVLLLKIIFKETPFSSLKHF